MGTPTWGATGRGSVLWPPRRPSSRTPLRHRWALPGALAAACALGVAWALSLGGSPGVRVPPAVVVHTGTAATRTVSVLPAGAPSGTPAGAEAKATGEEGVTVVTAAPRVVVEPSDGSSSAASGGHRGDSGGDTGDGSGPTGAPSSAGAGTPTGPATPPVSGGSSDGGSGATSTTSSSSSQTAPAGTPDN